MRGDLSAKTIRIAGHGGDDIAAYVAEPTGDGPFGGVVVIHHMPGWDDTSKEIARRFAAEGYNAILPHLHYREGPESSPDDAAAAARAKGGVPDERLLGDVEASIAHLRGLSSSNGKVGCIGYCSGGRQSLLVACSLGVDAAVDCYGAFVLNPPPGEMPLRVGPIGHLIGDLRCPLLGLFGADDSYPTPDEVDQLAKLLESAGKDFDFHSYEGAGHAFFSVDREAYRPLAAVDGWERILAFYGAHLS